MQDLSTILDDILSSLSDFTESSETPNYAENYKEYAEKIVKIEKVLGVIKSNISCYEKNK